MEEALQYCMHELAFDGDLGCTIDRLKVFIRNYYEGLQPPFVQTFDAAFVAFVWQLLRQQPSIQIKLIKETSLEVYIAPQKSKANKHDIDNGELAFESGTELLNHEARTMSLAELIQTYGDGLRIAVDPETCFRALTGSHIRQPKLTPMVYTALQLISRSREEGLSVVDLGKKTGYDQKTCFYLVKQLLSMDYVVKLAKGGLGGGNFCIHKSFYLRSPFWKGIRDETAELDRKPQEGDKQHGQSFIKIDSRHLASPELIKSRIIKLLKMSENGLHSYHNLLVAIGFQNPTKQDRRFFIIRIRELIKENVIEKVLVPRKGKRGSKVLCVRLAEDSRSLPFGGVVMQNDDLDDEEQEQGEEGPESSKKHDTSPQITQVETGMLLVHMTIQRQIVRLLEEAGADGLTLNDISTRLGTFDKRTLDLLLHRLANSPPPHLADLGICIFIESLGRERRNRYFTFSGYDGFIRNENIDISQSSAPSSTVDKSLCGHFNTVSAELYYGDRKKLIKYEDDQIKPSKPGPRRISQKTDELPKASKSKTIQAESSTLSSSRGKKRRRSGDFEPTTAGSLTSTNKRARILKKKDQKDIITDSERVFDTTSADKMDVSSTFDHDVIEITPTVLDIQQATSEASSLNTYGSIRNKRAADTHDSQRTKRLKVEKTTRSTVNLSQLRAENEIIRVVHESGGIANIASKEFFEAHSNVLSSLAANGESISMPIGAQLDRRTLRKILDKLVERGRLKTLTVTVTPRSVQPRIAKLIYVPDISQNQLESFVGALQDQTPSINTVNHKELETAVDFSHYLRIQDVSSQAASPLEAATTLNKPDGGTRSRRVIEFIGSDEGIRTRLLADSRTSSQVFGFILGKAKRARELHQYTLHALLNNADSENIVSRYDRIMSLSYYFCDIPVSTYFSVVSAPEFNQDLYNLMKTDSGRQMRIGDLPPSLYQTLGIGKTRARSRMLDLMEILMSLGLITPLKPSTSKTPVLTCSNQLHPTSYDITLTSDNSLNKMALYWQFNEVAAIYNYSQPDWPPSFCRDIFVRTADESNAYWDELEKACLEKGDITASTSAGSVTGPCKCVPSVAQTLRKRSFWSSAYVLSWEQEQYLQQKWTNSATGYTPLSDEDGGRYALIRICEIVSAPFDTVYNYFLHTHQAFQKEARRISRKNRREAGDGHSLEEKASLAKTIADSKQRLASDWEGLVQEVYPGVPSRKVAALKGLRIEYMNHSGMKSLEEWKARISEALKGYAIKDRFISGQIACESQRNLTERAYEGTPVEELVQKLKDSSPFAALGKKKKGDKSSAHKSRSRRFNWTAEYDELARDASAIIRSRCRSWGRVDWTALDQVFLPLPRNNVRQRMVTLRQEPGGESYFRRLERKWHQIWVEHRQTELLPDPNPEHPSDFDLIAHIEFLRKNIDKSSLKLGGLDSHVEDLSCALSEDVSEFLSKWDVIEYPCSTDSIDIMWSSVAEEQRENMLLRQAFVIGRDPNRSAASLQVDRLSIAECALKMVLLTPENIYDLDLASTFLKSIGKRIIGLATENLLSHGVIIETVKSDRQIPGRNMRLTDLNLEASGGFFRPEFYKQALGIDDILEEDIDDNKDWDLLSQSGQMAGLVDFVSRNEVRLIVDISGPIFHRKALDWNSKKVDDDQLETMLSVRYHYSNPNLDLESQVASPSLFKVDVTWDAHEPSDGSACYLVSNGIIDCSSCLDTVHNYFMNNAAGDMELYMEIAQMIETAGPNGLSHESVNDYLIMSDAKRLRLLHSMLLSKPPLCCWTGYSQPILVSARHIRPWTVLLPTSPTTYIFPRRWIDIKGGTTSYLWQSALCAVVSVLFLRPGLSLAELRRKLISVYDRQEVNDILQYLLTNNFISMATPKSVEFWYLQFSEIGVSDEKHVALWLTYAERWYDVFKE